MAELDVKALNIALAMAAGCLEQDDRPNTAFVVRQAIAVLKDCDRLRAAAQEVVDRWLEGEDSENAWDNATDALRAALEGRNG